MLERKFSVKEIKAWNAFPQQKMLFFSIPKELFIKLAFGQNPLIAKHNCILDLDGKKKVLSGFGFR